eukprot:1157451-Pelagomonas_calceolata.AAC.7
MHVKHERAPYSQHQHMSVQDCGTLLCRGRCFVLNLPSLVQHGSSCGLHEARQAGHVCGSPGACTLGARRGL